MSDKQQTMSVTPLDAPAGAKVTGVDLSQPLTPENGEGILDALAEHGVLVFPDQTLTPAQQVEFSRLFGEVEINHNAARFGIEGSPEIYIISNVTKDGKPIGSSRAGDFELGPGAAIRSSPSRESAPAGCRAIPLGPLVT